jgi:hypothetical protein
VDAVLRFDMILKRVHTAAIPIYSTGRTGLETYKNRENVLLLIEKVVQSNSEMERMADAPPLGVTMLEPHTKLEVDLVELSNLHEKRKA